MRLPLAVFATLFMSPLSAQFLPPAPSTATRELRYSLSDRSYVAIFVILPGHGVALLYPFDAPSAMERAGDHEVPLQGAQMHAAERSYGLLVNGDQADQAYLLLVASRRPLLVDRYMTRQEALDSALGPAVQRSESVDALVTGLVKLVADVSSADDIATDVDEARRVIPRRR